MSPGLSVWFLNKLANFLDVTDDTFPASEAFWTLFCGDLPAR